MQNPVIEIKNLYKTYRHQESPALQDINFDVFEGEKVGLIGANGSGKTTLLRLILNLILPEKGTIRINGLSDLEKAKKSVGFVSEHQYGYENFTPLELLNLAGKMTNLSGENIKKRSEEILHLVQLEKQQGLLVSSFSKGMVQRLQLALALIHQPTVLLLDEPMSGLDPSGQNDLRDTLHQLENYTLLYASHNLSEIEEFCERVLIFHQGKILREINLTKKSLDLLTIESEPAILEIIKKYSEIELRRHWKGKGSFQVEIIIPQEFVQEFFSVCRDSDIPIKRFRSRSLLEDLYDTYVKKK